MFESCGTLRYSPKALSKGPVSDNWWVVLDCDPELGRFYRHLYLQAARHTDKLVRPYWKEHITVVRNEEPPADKKPLWGRDEGRVFTFQYSPVIEDNDMFFWLRVHCPELLDLREELGLPRHPAAELHLTVGNNKKPDRPT
jgi:hypothetical protein